MKITAWNTGRRYSKFRQRMAFTQVNDLVVFVDIDRGIEGSFVDEFGWVDKSKVMAAYDAGEYHEMSGCGRDAAEIVKALKFAAKEQISGF